MKKEGVTLPLDQETMPSDLYQVLTKGLQANYELRDLNLQEIRDVFHKNRVNFSTISFTLTTYPKYAGKHIPE